jgi:hypothetical protein
VEVICDKCGATYGIGDYPFCKGGHGPYNVSVIDDELEGGPRRFETMGDDAPFIASKSQWKREVDARGLIHVDRHDRAYYRTRFRLHDQELRDTGSNREY